MPDQVQLEQYGETYERRPLYVAYYLIGRKFKKS